MKTLLLTLSLVLTLISCKKDEPEPPSCPTCATCPALEAGPRLVTTVSNARISYGGQLLNSFECYSGDEITVFVQNCDAPAVLHVASGPDITVNCTTPSAGVFHWMVQVVVP